MSGECDKCAEHATECECHRFGSDIVSDSYKMKTKNPYDCETLEEAQEVGFFWMQKCQIMGLREKALMDLAIEGGVNPSLDQIIKRMNELVFKENAEWGEDMDII